MIFRASNYAILSATARCNACGKPTHVVAIAVPIGHEICTGDAWEPGSSAARLFYVESIPASARLRLHLLAPWYRPAPSSPVSVDGSRDYAGTYWVNHCEHCDAPLDDHDLHCEPDGAFAAIVVDFGALAEARILRWDIGEQFVVVAGGCGEDPSA